MKRDMFECDVCGDLHGHITDMMEFEVRASHEHLGDVRRRFESPDTIDVHVCIEDIPEGAYDELKQISYASGDGYIGVTDYDCTVECMVVFGGERGRDITIIQREALSDELIDFIEENVNL